MSLTCTPCSHFQYLFDKCNSYWNYIRTKYKIKIKLISYSGLCFCPFSFSRMLRMITVTSWTMVHFERRKLYKKNIGFFVRNKRALDCIKVHLKHIFWICAFLCSFTTKKSGVAKDRDLRDVVRKIAENHLLFITPV